jgi:hypothetical protein
MRLAEMFLEIKIESNINPERVARLLFEKKYTRKFEKGR